VISWLFLIATYLLPPISLTLAIVSRKQISRSGGVQGGEKLALIAILLSILIIAYIAFMLGLGLLGL
jgi:hypothetical protein